MLWLLATMAGRSESDLATVAEPFVFVIVCMGGLAGSHLD